MARLERIVHLSNGLRLPHHHTHCSVTTTAAPAQFGEVLGVPQRGNVQDDVRLCLYARQQAADVKLAHHSTALFSEPEVDDCQVLAVPVRSSLELPSPKIRRFCADSDVYGFVRAIVCTCWLPMPMASKEITRGRTWLPPTKNRSSGMPPTLGSCTKSSCTTAV
eukprot:6192545-Pleurochrysis_carterae.AAC.1